MRRDPHATSNPAQPHDQLGNKIQVRQLSLRAGTSGVAQVQLTHVTVATDIAAPTSVRTNLR